MSFLEKYQPASLSDVVFHDVSVKNIIDNYEQGHTTDPLLMYGPPGTGKTSIATLLPKAIAPKVQELEIKKFNCGIRGDARDIGTRVQDFGRVAAYNSSNRRFVILDEIDCLDKQSQNAVRGVMDQLQSSVQFILTTNHIDRLKQALRSRTLEIEILASSSRLWLPRAKWIMRQENLVFNDQMLEQVIDVALKNGGNREILKALGRLSASSQKSAGSASQKAPVVQLPRSK